MLLENWNYIFLMHTTHLFSIRCTIVTLNSVLHSAANFINSDLHTIWHLRIPHNRMTTQVPPSQAYFPLTRLGVRQTESSRNRPSSLNILACSSRSAHSPLSRLPSNLGLRRIRTDPSGLDSVCFAATHVHLTYLYGPLYCYSNFLFVR